ncbi:MAG: NRDE family protein [Burkholderiaceae bacterium]|nr:NRDE family protein [Burkholderiaceae bacterium]
MCLIGLHLGKGPSLLIAANRDEFADRPTEPLHWWQEDILAGRDLRAKGTWLGITRSGRFAAITNVRDPSIGNAAVPYGSRGLMVHAYLSGNHRPLEFLERMLQEVTVASPYNLIVGRITADGIDAHWLGGRTRQIAALDEGPHVLSNAELNTPWPKARRLLSAMKTADTDAITQVMHSPEIAQDAELPNTGVPYAWEKRLSAALISGDDYHTRSSTLIHVEGLKALAREITWSAQAEPIKTVEERFLIAESVGA